jgi:hypothetical protein
MAQTVLITLTVAGADTGPFSLFSDADGYVTPFETGVPKSSLVSGYTSVLVPDLATIIRVQSTSVLCPNYVDLPIGGLTTTTTTTAEPTTTTTTSTSSTTTTTTTTEPPTTTTTTTTVCQDCATNDFTLYDDGLVTWTSCDGAPGQIVGTNGETLSIPCHIVGTLSGPGITSNTVICGSTCPTTTTTTTTP